MLNLSFPGRRAMHGLSLAAGVAALAACSTVNGASERVVNVFTPYRAEVVQGNFVSKEQVQALKPGMNRMQVRMILGTPLLTSLFHANRWDYVFSIRRQGVQPQLYKLAVFFDGDQLERFDGDEMPSETEFVARISTKQSSAKVPRLEATPEELEKAAPAKAPATDARPEAVEPAPASSSYPPLEVPSR